MVAPLEPSSSWGWSFVAPGAPLERVERPLPVPGVGQVRIRVAGCGLCHTDLGFLHHGVRTRHPLPLVLGHEISGVVDASGPSLEHWLGRAVVVPAVIPCGSCPDCDAGAPMICKLQVMPGNDLDGGFATHVVVPARGLCVVPGAAAPDAPLGASGVTLRHLSVLADAVSTPWQAIVRSGVQPGDLAIVVGLGGVGGFAAQILRHVGARVVGLDVSPSRLAEAGALGCGLALDPRASDARSLKAQISEHARALGAPSSRWRIFECSGTAAGQATAFHLLVHGATLSIVGFTLDRVEVRLSNLMALDARVIGNWGCAPEHYPTLVELALSGSIDLIAPTELRPLTELPFCVDPGHGHGSGRRVILVPDLERSAG